MFSLLSLIFISSIVRVHYFSALMIRKLRIRECTCLGEGTRLEFNHGLQTLSFSRVSRSGKKKKKKERKGTTKQTCAIGLVREFGAQSLNTQASTF